MLGGFLSIRIGSIFITYKHQRISADIHFKRSIIACDLGSDCHISL